MCIKHTYVHTHAHTTHAHTHININITFFSRSSRRMSSTICIRYATRSYFSRLLSDFVATKLAIGSSLAWINCHKFPIWATKNLSKKFKWWQFKTKTCLWESSTTFPCLAKGHSRSPVRCPNALVRVMLWQVRVKLWQVRVKLWQGSG